MCRVAAVQKSRPLSRTFASVLCKNNANPVELISRTGTKNGVPASYFILMLLYFGLYITRKLYHFSAKVKNSWLQVQVEKAERVNERALV